MGKKNKKEKKGQGKEKTLQKTEKKANKRMKKELAEKGEVSWMLDKIILNVELLFLYHSLHETCRTTAGPLVDRRVDS